MTASTRDILGLVGISLVMTVLVVLFREQVARAIDLMGSFSGSPYAVLIAIGVFLIGSFFFLPQWALIAAAVAAFGLVEGTGIAWLATMVATWVHLILSSTLETRLRRRIADDRLDRLRALFRANSVQSGFVVRLIPTGPAVLVNIAAGLFGLNRTGFLIGTALGIVPKILLTGIVASELISSARGQQIGLGLILAGLLLVAFLALTRRKARDLMDEGDKLQ